MFREVLRSTLYSSSRPFSSNATRRSSFSTLITNLLPVLGVPRPKIRLTFSIISGEIGCDHERSVGGFGLRLVPIRLFHHLRTGRCGCCFGGGVGAGAGFGRAPKSLSKKLSLRGGGVATTTGRGAFFTLPAASGSGSTEGSALVLAMSLLVEPSRFSSSVASIFGPESLNVAAGIIWNGLDLWAGAIQATCC